jgi:hypothetical protein
VNVIANIVNAMLWRRFRRSLGMSTENLVFKLKKWLVEVRESIQLFLRV